MIVPFEESPVAELAGDALPPRATARLGGEPLVHPDVWAARDLPHLGRVVSISRHSLRISDRVTGALQRAFRPLPPVSELRWITLVDIGRDGALVWLHEGVVRRWVPGDDEVTVLIEGLPEHHGIALAVEDRLLVGSGGWPAPGAVYCLEERRRLYGFPDGDSIAFSPDGGKALFVRDISCQSGSDLLAFYVCDARTGEVVDHGDERTCYDQSMYWSKDGARLLYGNRGCEAQRVWTVGEGWGGRSEVIGPRGGASTLRSMVPLRMQLGFGEAVDEVDALAFDADGGRIATPARVWDLRTGGATVLDPYRYRAQGVAIRGERVLRLFASGASRTWDLAAGEALPKTGRPFAGLEAHAFSPDGGRIAYVSTVEAKGGVKLAGLPPRGATRWPRQGATEAVARRKVSLAWSADGSTIVAGTADGGVLRWDADSGALLGDVCLGEAGLLGVLAVSPEGRAVAAASWEVFGLARDGDVVLREGTAHPERVRALAFSPDGQLLAVGRDDGDLQLVRLADLAVVETLRGHAGATTALAFSPDGRSLASGVADGTVVLWDVVDLLAVRA